MHGSEHRYTVHAGQDCKWQAQSCDGAHKKKGIRQCACNRQSAALDVIQAHRCKRLPHAGVMLGREAPGKQL